MAESFTHRHAGHCESGVISSMLSHHGLNLSEPMAFGIAGALTFFYFPIVKVNNMPLIAYRMMPRSIIKNVRDKLGITMAMQTFRSETEGMKVLDELLTQGHAVGAQTSVYWLPYFPENMRFHFNAHNLIVYGKEGDDYLISDPIGEVATRCDAASLQKARFAKGLMAPKGFIYYPTHVPKEVDYERVIPGAIDKVCKMMIKAPIPLVGIRGIKRMAKGIERLERKEKLYSKLFLGHIIRMQEEIGTGGAGFRYMYASFLQESGTLLGNNSYNVASQMLTATGDLWREFALMVAKAIRGKKSERIDFEAISKTLIKVAASEEEVFRYLWDKRK